MESSQETVWGPLQVGGFTHMMHLGRFEGECPALSVLRGAWPPLELGPCRMPRMIMHAVPLPPA